ncbi:alpha-L-fucosidase, partial [Sphingobium lactosutens]|uniref:alpha-L-fucosidase n=1 Tax=Sphingobium lactosutens TaxID=522773 RepID=UPI0015B8AC9C
MAITLDGMLNNIPAIAGTTFQLPELPPMPELDPLRPEESVDMADPTGWTETKLSFPIADGPFGPDWADIEKAYPDNGTNWLREAKFGIWVHFGPQAAGNSGDWYAKYMYDPSGRWGNKAYESHIKNFGHQSEVGYKDVLKDWNPINLHPDALVDLYEKAGAKFLLIQGVHHDNYDNWNSKYQKWNSVNVGPKRDLLGEWTKAARRAGMKYGVTFHHEYTWWWWQTAFGADKTGPKAGIPYDGHLTAADGKGKWWDGLDPRMLYTVNLREYRGLDTRWAPAGGIFQNHQKYAEWYATWWAYRMMDVIENYDPDFIYTDGDSQNPFTGEKSGTGAKNNAASRVIAHYYNRTAARRKSVDTFSVIKFKKPTKGLVTTEENGFPEGIKREQPWIGEVPVGDWFYGPGFIYEASSVIRYVLETASRDGASAVCVPIRPDGSLDPECRRMLGEIGQWMALNGEGIYGSKAWRVLGEGEIVDGKLKVSRKGALGERQHAVSFDQRDFRFTQGRDGAVYAFCLVAPDAGTILTIRSFAGKKAEKVKSAHLLGRQRDLNWSQDGDGLKIEVPRDHGHNIAMGFRI